MKTSSCKAKGRRAAAEAKALMLLHSLGALEDDDITITSSGSTGEDLLLSPKARKLYPFGFECKNVEKINIWSAIAQAQAHTDGTDRRPIVVFKRNNHHLRCIVDFSLFLELVNKACATIQTSSLNT